MVEKQKKSYFSIIRIFLAAVFSSMLNTSVIGQYIIKNIPLPEILSNALLIGVFVLLFDFVLKEIGI